MPFFAPSVCSSVSLLDISLRQTRSDHITNNQTTLQLATLATARLVLAFFLLSDASRPSNPQQQLRQQLRLRQRQRQVIKHPSATKQRERERPPISKNPERPTFPLPWVPSSCSAAHPGPTFPGVPLIQTSRVTSTTRVPTARHPSPQAAALFLVSVPPPLLSNKPSDQNRPGKPDQQDQPPEPPDICPFRPARSRTEKKQEA